MFGLLKGLWDLAIGNRKPCVISGSSSEESVEAGLSAEPILPVLLGRHGAAENPMEEKYDLRELKTAGNTGAHSTTIEGVGGTSV